MQGVGCKAEGIFVHGTCGVTEEDARALFLSFFFSVSLSLSLSLCLFRARSLSLSFSSLSSLSLAVWHTSGLQTRHTNPVAAPPPPAEPAALPSAPDPIATPAGEHGPYRTVRLSMTNSLTTAYVVT